jgi:hypothetical protein
MPSIRIDAHYDEQATVRVVSGEEIAGLVVEADTFEQLREEVLAAVPELIFFDEWAPEFSRKGDVSAELLQFTSQL